VFFLLMNRFVRTTTGLTCLGASFGCYGLYAPQSSRLTGRDLELQLTDSGSVMLTPRVGLSVESIAGRLLVDSAGVYAMSVESTRRRDGIENSWRGERLDVPHVFVSTLAERRFSAARTTLFAGAMTAALIAIKGIFAGAGSSNSPGGVPGGPTPR
jgi:hypothetical protein